MEAVLDCSLAVVAPHAQQPAQQEPGAGAAGTTTGAAPTDRQQPSQYESARPFQVLLSRGHGDLVLVRVPAGGGGNSGGNSGGSGSAAQMSNPVFPVRPRAPLAGVRPVTLEAAVEHANGGLGAVREADWNTLVTAVTMAVACLASIGMQPLCNASAMFGAVLLRSFFLGGELAWLDAPPLVMCHAPLCQVPKRM